MGRRKKVVDTTSEYRVKCPKCNNFRAKSEMCYGFSYVSCIYCSAIQKVTANYTVFLPKRMREALQIHPGTVVNVKVEGSKIIIEKTNQTLVESAGKLEETHLEGIEDE